MVKVGIRKDYLKKTKNQNLMLIAKAISSLKLEASDMKPSPLEVQRSRFQTKTRPTVHSAELRKLGIDAFIPRHNTEKIRLITSIPTDVDLSDIIKESTSPCKIIKAIEEPGRVMTHKHFYLYTKRS